MAEQSDTLKASKILVDFIRDFSVLTEAQILAVRELMEQTVLQVMKSVDKMTEEASEQREKATEVLVLDSENGDKFVRSDVSNLERREQAQIQGGGDERDRKDHLESKLMRTGGVFTKHMEAMSRMNHSLQQLVHQVVGAVSMDDVLAQRLSHIIVSLDNLQSDLTEVITNYKSYNNPNSMIYFRNKVLTKVYLTYTMEEEKEVFHEVFGHPKEGRKSS